MMFISGTNSGFTCFESEIQNERLDQNASSNDEMTNSPVCLHRKLSVFLKATN